MPISLAGVALSLGAWAVPNSASADQPPKLALELGGQSSVAVGETITLTAVVSSNDSSPVTVTALGLNPSCNNNDCNPYAPGVFNIESAVGGAATDSPGCPGVVFAVAGPTPPESNPPDPANPFPGSFTLTPPTPLTLGQQPGGGCRVEVTLRALKLPPPLPTGDPFDAQPLVLGLQVEPALIAYGPTGVTGGTGVTGATGAITVSLPSPDLALQTTASAMINESISANATVSGAAGGAPPTGSVHFAVYAPGDTACATPLPESSDANLDATGKATSQPLTASVQGTYRWVASYGGDLNYAATSTACGALGTTEVTGAPTTLKLVASPPVAPGQAIFATATLAGGTSPTGTINFAAWRNDPTCDGSPDLTSSATVTENGDFVSDQFTSTVIGTYTFTASYSGDTANTPVATTCDDPGTSVVVSSPGTVLPTLSLDGAAATDRLPAPGGTFTYHVTVTNTSTEPVTTKTLVDSVYGDLAGKGSCKVDVALKAAGDDGDSYSCSYTGDFKGAAGAKQTATVKATAEDPVGNQASESHDITVSLSDPPKSPGGSATTTTTTSDPTTTTVPAATTGSGGSGGRGALAFTGAGLTQQLGLGIGCVLAGLMLIRYCRRRAEPSTSTPTRRS